MTPTELILMANKHYPEGFLLRYFDERTGRKKEGHGDTLAFSIVLNLVETFDESLTSEDQAAEGVRVIDSLVDDLERVKRGLLAEPPERGLFDE